MPTAQLPGDLLMHYDDEDFTDPWSPAETVVLHHGNAKSAKLWYGWVPLLARDYLAILGSPTRLSLVAGGIRDGSRPSHGSPRRRQGAPDRRDHRGHDRARVRLPVPRAPAYRDHCGAAHRNGVRATRRF